MKTAAGKQRALYNRMTQRLRALISNKGRDCNYLQHGKLIIRVKRLGEWWRESWWRAMCSRSCEGKTGECLGLILAITLPQPAWYIEMLASLCGPCGFYSTQLLLKWHASYWYQRQVGDSTGVLVTLLFLKFNVDVNRSEVQETVSLEKSSCWVKSVNHFVGFSYLLLLTIWAISTLN